MANYPANLELRHGVRLDPQRDGSWDNADGTSSYIRESITYLFARRGIDPGGDRAFALDPSGEMTIRLDDPDGQWSRWGANARTDLEGTPIRLELLVERDSGGVYFGAFVLWGGWIESIDFKIKKIGSHEVVINCLGPIAQAARTKVPVEARYGTTFQESVQAIETSWGRSRLLAPGSPGKPMRLWWQEEEATVLDSLTELVVAEDGRMFEGRSQQIRIYANGQLDVASRFMDSQVLLVSPMVEPNNMRESSNYRYKVLLDHARAITYGNAWSNPEGYNAVSDLSGIEVQPPENVILNRIDYNVNSFALNGTSAEVWSSTYSFALSRSNPSETITAIVSDDLVVVDWVTPVAGTHFSTTPSPTNPITVETIKTARRMEVTFRMHDDDLLANESTAIADLSFNGRLATINNQHYEISRTNDTSISEFGERTLQYFNKYLIDEPSAPIVADRSAGREQSEETINGILHRYSTIRLRTYVDIDANLAGRWAVEELSVPHSRVTLNAQLLHLGAPEDHWIRGWQYTLPTGGDRANLRLILEPVETRDRPYITVNQTLVEQDNAAIARQ